MSILLALFRHRLENENMNQSFKSFALVLGVVTLLSACGSTPSSVTRTRRQSNFKRMLIRSPAFSARGTIPAQYTCDGKNVSPPLAFSSVPDGTKSLVVYVDDPDAKNFIHWLMYNIDPATTEIKEGMLPKGALEGMTSFETAKYGGPCPPSDSHRYLFHVFALDNDLKFDTPPKTGDVIRAMRDHILAQGLLQGTYERTKR